MVGHVEHLFDTTFVQLFCVVAAVLSTKVSTMDNIKIMGFVDRAIDVDTYIHHNPSFRLKIVDF